jgi:hypothetical protein
VRDFELQEGIRDVAGGVVGERLQLIRRHIGNCESGGKMEGEHRKDGSEFTRLAEASSPTRLYGSARVMSHASEVHKFTLSALAYWPLLL